MIAARKNESNPRFGRIAPIVYDSLSSLGRDELRVLVALGRYADSNWIARPSIRTLARDVGIDNRHIGRALASLANRGLVTCKSGNTTTANEYDLRGVATDGDTVLPPAARGVATDGNRVLPQMATKHIDNRYQQQQQGAAAAKISSEDGRSLDAAKHEVQRRIAAGQTIRNPAGLARVLARDGWDAAEPKADLSSTIREARNAKLADLRTQFGLREDYDPARPATVTGVASDTRTLIDNELSKVARRIRAEHNRSSEARSTIGGFFV